MNKTNPFQHSSLIANVLRSAAILCLAAAMLPFHTAEAQDLCDLLPEPYAGCGEIIPAGECPQSFVPEIGDGSPELQDFGPFVPRCRVEITGLSGPPHSCTSGDKEPAACLACCFHNTNITACDDSGPTQCKLDLFAQIVSLEVTNGDMDGGITNKKRPDPFVGILVSSGGTSSYCRYRWAASGVKRNKDAGSHPHQGFIAIFKGIYPFALTDPSHSWIRVIDSDTGGTEQFGRHDRMASGSTEEYHSYSRCRYDASGSGDGANFDAVTLRPLGKRSTSSAPTIGRSFPSSIGLGQSMIITLVVEVGLENSGSPITVDEEIPYGYEFVSASLPPTIDDLIGEEDEDFGTRLTWAIDAPVPGVDEIITYTVTTPPTSTLLRQFFRSETTQDGQVYTTGLRLEELMPGHVVDCNTNGIPDLVEIWTDEAADTDGNFVIDGCNPVATSPLASTAELHSAYPAPFSSSTTIQYDLPAGSLVSLRIHDLSGRLVRNLESTEKPAGRYATIWNGRDDAGRRVAAGVYVYRLEAGDTREAKKIVLVN